MSSVSCGSGDDFSCSVNRKNGIYFSNCFPIFVFYVCRDSLFFRRNENGSSRAAVDQIFLKPFFFNNWTLAQGYHGNIGQFNGQRRCLWWNLFRITVIIIDPPRMVRQFCILWNLHQGCPSIFLFPFINARRQANNCPPSSSSLFCGWISDSVPVCGIKCRRPKWSHIQVPCMI